MQTGLFECVKNIKVFVSCLNAHQRVISEKEDLSNQVDRYQSASFPRHLCQPNALINNVVMVGRMEVIPGFSNMDLHSPRPAWLQPLLTAQSASSRDQHQVPYMTQFPRVISLVAGWFHWTCFHHSRGSISFYWNIFTLGRGLPSLHAMLLPKLPSITPYPPSWCSHSITFDQMISFHSNEVQQWAHAHGIHLYHMPYCSEAACLTEW